MVPVVYTPKMNDLLLIFLIFGFVKFNVIVGAPASCTTSILEITPSYMIGTCPSGYGYDIFDVVNGFLAYPFNTNGNVTISSSSSYLNFNSSFAFDGDMNTAWRTANLPTFLYGNHSANIALYTGETYTIVDNIMYVGEWIQIRLYAQIRLKYYALFPFYTASSAQHTQRGFLSQGPAAFIIAGSNDSISWNSR